MAQDPAEDLQELLPEEGVLVHPVRRVLSVIGGLLCLLLGIVGWLVPVVTGIPFYALGIALLGMASRRVRRLVNRTERRLPMRLRLALRRWTPGARRRPASP